MASRRYELDERIRREDYLSKRTRRYLLSAGVVVAWCVAIIAVMLVGYVAVEIASGHAEAATRVVHALLPPWGG
jgi:hypothetical protein